MKKVLEDIIEIINPTSTRVEDAENKKQEIKRKEALACKDKAMTTWAKAGKSGQDSNCDSDEDADSKKKPTNRRGRNRRENSDAFKYLPEKKHPRKQRSKRKKWSYTDSSCSFS